jgi:hypothetical protein
VFGKLLTWFHSYDAVLISMAVVLLAGAALWLMVDATELLVTDEEPQMPPGVPLDVPAL